jgi:hypothetical protein
VNIVGLPSVEERLLMKRIPWRTFSERELEEIAGAADRMGDARLLALARAASRRRESDKQWAVRCREVAT